MSEILRDEKHGDSLRTGCSKPYDYDYNVVVLGGNLKDFPKAHEYVKKHELEHAEHGKPKNRRMIDFLRLEWKTDVDCYFSSREELEEVREYHESRSASGVSGFMELKVRCANVLRGGWNLILHPAGKVYLKLRRERLH